MQDGISVSFLYEEEGVAKYWFKANVPGHEQEELKFCITESYSIACASKKFNKLDQDTQKYLIKLARAYLIHIHSRIGHGKY